MLSLGEALAEDAYPAVCPLDDGGEDDPVSGWDLDVFPEIDLRPELRLFAGAPPDLAVRCRGGRVLAAHRAVLAEVGYFQAMLNGSFREHGAESLEVDEEPEVIFEVLRWVYCRDASVDKDLVLDMFRVAEFYGIDSLVEHCSRALAAQELGGPRDLAAAAAARAEAEEQEARAAGHEAEVAPPQLPAVEAGARAPATIPPGPPAAGVTDEGERPGSSLSSTMSASALEAVPSSPQGGGASIRLPKAKDL
mmetsp:Transcript_60624/g.180555  ORF Transcript_60624/g.180555 Transcript_60624/m.180555 type:complete len:250 (+) Transcript_60624:128-877(+)